MLGTASKINFISITVMLLTLQCRPQKADGHNNIQYAPVLSFSQNPGNNWQVGYTLSNKLNLTEVKYCTYADTGSLIAMWHPSATASGYYPYTAQNRDAVTRQDVSGRWALKSGQIAMEGSNTGQYSVLQFIVPASGNYKIKAVFEGIHIGLSTTDVHVLIQTKSLFSDVIDGYGGDSAFHAITGAHPSATFSDTVYLNKNELVTFAVGYGPNKTHYNDTTGLTVLIESL